MESVDHFGWAFCMFEEKIDLFKGLLKNVFITFQSFSSVWFFFLRLCSVHTCRIVCVCEIQPV